MKKTLDEIDEQKEMIKLKIMKTFTELRNALNNREDELLNEIDKRFKEIYFNEKLINENQKIENQIKIYLDKKKNMNINTCDINQFINEIDILDKNGENLENKIKELSTLFNNFTSYKIYLEFRPGSGGVAGLLKKIRNFWDIYINENNGIKIYKCFNTIKEENNVLLISNKKFQLINDLLKLNEKINKISISSPNIIISKLLYQDIYKYKIIIYDLWDSGYNIKENNYENIKKYLDNGGNIIITHDLSDTYIRLLNLKLINPGIFHCVKKAKKNK